MTTFRISNTSVVLARKGEGSAYLMRAQDRLILTQIPMPSIDAVRRTWHAFIREYDDAEGAILRYNPMDPDNEFLDALQACVDSKPWEQKVDIFGGDL